jgi:hypothetical protein
MTQPELFAMAKYDKRRDLPFRYTQFIKFKSNRPVRQAYNVIISQVLPILYISNDTESAVLEIEILLNTLSSNGFQETRLRNLVVKWLSTGQFPASRIHIPTATLLLSR